MNQEQMTAALEELLPTEAALLRCDGAPNLNRGALAMLLILAKKNEAQNEQIKKQAEAIDNLHEYLMMTKERLTTGLNWALL
jgi:hypothetical protein